MNYTWVHKISNSVLIQWGKTASGEWDSTLNYPISFNTVYTAQVTINGYSVWDTIDTCTNTYIKIITRIPNGWSGTVITHFVLIIGI